MGRSCQLTARAARMAQNTLQLVHSPRQALTWRQRRITIANFHSHYGSFLAFQKDTVRTSP